MEFEVFEVHLSTGVGVGAYVLVVCASRNVLVYRNGLHRLFAR